MSVAHATRDDIPPRLYHGTTAAVAEAALRDGLRTRRTSGVASRWPAHPSHAGAVYLTTAYALYFAMHTLDEPTDGARIGLVEVASRRVQHALVPDEDVLEQVGRGKDAVGGDLGTRTRWYRKRLHEFAGRGQWVASVRAMGTCAHLGDIPATAVTRVALIEPQRQPELCLLALDPLITVANYQLVGARYRALVQRVWLGGDGITILTATGKVSP